MLTVDKILVGNFIREQRKNKNLTQEQLAQILSISDKAISKWERGHSFPDVMLFESIADALDISLTELLQGRTDTLDTKKDNSIQCIQNTQEETMNKHIDDQHSTININQTLSDAIHYGINILKRHRYKSFLILLSVIIIILYIVTENNNRLYHIMFEAKIDKINEHCLTIKGRPTNREGYRDIYLVSIDNKIVKGDNLKEDDYVRITYVGRREDLRNGEYVNNVEEIVFFTPTKTL